ncbi:MAG TPA: PHP domain-containing protein, partial [Thermoanaerobaculia bacterium]|nr:PHP domain-containing protein [Thermoanaerobaculia bacterium]
MPFGGADLHFHSTFSDGVESPAELVLRAVAAGLSVAALTDHDAVHGIPAFEAAAAGTGLVAAGGAELSVDDGGEDVHLLGLFLDPEEPELIERLTWFRRVRDQRGAAIVEKLAQLGVTLDLAALRAQVGAGAFGRPHVARALVAQGVVRSFGDAFDRYLGDGGPAFVPKAKWGLAEAIGAVRRAGGLAILAHPVWYRDPGELLR